MNYLVDTCFWIALYDPTEDPKRTEEAETIASLIQNENILIPFPTMYEFLNSKFSSTKHVHVFEKLINRPNYFKIHDENYRDEAHDNFFYNSRFKDNKISLVDEIIKKIILEKKHRIDFLITFDNALKNFAIANGVKTI